MTTLNAAWAAPAPTGQPHRPVDQRSIDVATGSIEADLVALRRDIHEHPEVAGEERRTAALVADRLRAAGLAVATGVGGHGVVGMPHGARKGRTVAYRADMDAVPTGHTTGGSTDMGHLCGHDVHTTVQADEKGSATVGMSYRCWPEARYREVRDSVQAIAVRYDARAEFPDAPFPALLCPEQDGTRLERHLRRALGNEHVSRMHAVPPFNGEDFALFGQRIPVTYTFLGVRSSGAPVTTSFPHHVDFEPDERAISTGPLPAETATGHGTVRA